MIGAVHESSAALKAIADHTEADLVCVVTLSEQAASHVSGVVDLAREADSRGAPVLRVDDVNDPENVAWIRDRAPDLIAVVGWTRLIRDELLLMPTRGCIGFHASLLPRHRGRAPVNWSIIKGETETGSTMIMLNAGVDTGEIVAQRATPISVDDTCGTVYGRVAQLGADMLQDQLGPLLNGTAVTRRQDDALADVLPKRTPEMGVTDWRMPSLEVHNWIRAQTHPYPGAFTHLGAGRVMLWRSEPPGLDQLVASPTAPGEILEISNDGLRVSTGQGNLLVTAVGAPGATSSSAVAWAATVRAHAGDRFELPDPALAVWARGEGPRPSTTVVSSA